MHSSVAVGLSHYPNGITIPVYVAIIACLLITLWTGRKATRRTYEMLCHAFAGWATAAEVEAHIAKLHPLDCGHQERGPGPQLSHTLAASYPQFLV